MRRILDFYEFGGVNPVNESMKMARDYVIRRYAEEHKIKPSDLTDSQREGIINTKAMDRIKELTDDFPGYAPLFSMFHYDQRASFEKLEELKKDMLKYKTNMTDLPMSPMEYAKIVKTDKNPTTGYQQLIDDLAKIENKIKLRKLYKAFTSRMREEFKKATPEQINKLTEISNQLDKLPDLSDTLPDGQIVTQDAWRSFTSNLRKYDDLRTYPDFSDPQYAFSELISDAEKLIKAWGIGMNEITNRLKLAGVEAGIIYVGNGYIVLSARTAAALNIVAGSTSWCINGEYTFREIVGHKRIQLCLLNLNLSSVDPMSLIGLTVNAEGIIVDNANRLNNQIVEAAHKRYYDFMKNAGFPKAAIIATQDKFESEMEIKTFTDYFIGNGKNITEKFISKIFGVKSVFTDEHSSKSAYRVLGEIVEKIDPLIIVEMIDEYRENGICSDFSLNIFKNIFSQHCKKSDIEAIIKETLDAKNDSEIIIGKSEKFPSAYVSQAKITINAADDAIEYLRNLR